MDYIVIYSYYSQITKWLLLLEAAYKLELDILFTSIRVIYLKWMLY